MTEMHTAARRQGWRGAARLAAAGQIALWMVVWARPAPVMAAQAYVVGTDDDERWVIGNDQIRLTVEAGSAGEVRLLDLTVPQADTSWTVPTARPSGAGGAVAGAAFTGATAYTDLTIARLELAFETQGKDLRITRIFSCAAGSAVVDTWTRVERLTSSASSIGSLDALDLTVRNGALSWVTGLQAPAEEGGSFARRSRALDVGEQLSLGATGRSSERTVPWIGVESASDMLFVGLVWSGAWTLTADRSDQGLRLRLNVPGTTFRATDQSVETPRAYFGVGRPDSGGASPSMLGYMRDVLRGGRALDPLVTYNTWFAYGTHIDEESMRAEIDQAADLGVELFVLDAGWYPGATDDPSDFTPGLGTWTVDPARFPSGLAALREYAHDRGLLFGLWVEPERVAFDTVNRPDLARGSWLATHAGSYGYELDPVTRRPPAAQVCFADPRARQWVFGKLTALIDAVRPDYLKWDNNFWIDCDRFGHGHGASDGNAAHVRGLYDVLAAIRARYPDLRIENCSGGGNRTDLGLSPFTDVAWIDDRTAPSAHVRHNLEGLGAILPPASLLSFVIAGPSESLVGGDDLAYNFRSRMLGVLGLTWRGAEFSGADRVTVRREIAVYKQLREILPGAFTVLLSGQAGHAEGEDWDIVEQVSPTTGAAAVFAFAPQGRADAVLVRPLALRPDVSYAVASVDTGLVGIATGAELMAGGIRINPSPASRAQVVTFVEAREDTP